MGTPQTNLSNIKLTDLAAATGLKLSAVSRVVNGNRLSVPIGRAIADHLGRPLSDLFPAIHKKKLQAEARRQREPVRVPVDPVQIESLRKACKHLMVDLNLDYRGAYAVIAPRLAVHMGIRRVHHNALSMALTGFRNEAGTLRLLRALHDLLRGWPREAA